MRRVITIPSLLTVTFALATLVACVSEFNRGAPVKYGRLAVVPLESSVAVVQRESIPGWRTVERSHFHYRIFDVFDTAGRRSDNVWVQDGLVFDWNQYKSIALTDSKSNRLA